MQFKLDFLNDKSARRLSDKITVRIGTKSRDSLQLSERSSCCGGGVMPQGTVSAELFAQVQPRRHTSSHQRSRLRFYK